MICGVDEAGKGSVLGPMVIAAVGVSAEAILADLGLKDSKLLSEKERERLYPLIKKHCKVAVLKLDAQEIDAVRNEMTLNQAVARAHAKVISKLSPSCAYVDACDVNIFRYAEMVRCNLEKDCEIVSEHHADEKFPVVSAASIIAKVTRDRAIKTLGKKIRRDRQRVSLGSRHHPLSLRVYRHPPYSPADCPEELEDGQQPSCKKIPEQPGGFLEG